MRSIQTQFFAIDRLTFTLDRSALVAVGVRTEAGRLPRLVMRINVNEQRPNVTRLFEFPERTILAVSEDGLQAATPLFGHGATMIHMLTHDLTVGRRLYPYRDWRCEIVDGLALSPDGESVAIGYEGPMWDSHKPVPDYFHDLSAFGVCICRLQDEPEPLFASTTKPLCQMAISPHSKWLAATDIEGNNLWVFDFPTGRPVAHSSQSECPQLAFSPGGAYLASAGLSVTVRDTADWQRIAVLRGQDEDLPGIAFSPDERILGVARSDGPAEFWDVESGRLLRSYDWNIGRLSAIAFAPDGLTCAVAGTEGRIVIWDVDVD